MPAEGNGDLQTLICVLVARRRRCLTLSNPVPWQNWLAAYLGYTLQMKTLFRGWPVMVHDTHTRRRSAKHDLGRFLQRSPYRSLWILRMFEIYSFTIFTMADSIKVLQAVICHRNWLCDAIKWVANDVWLMCLWMSGPCCRCLSGRTGCSLWHMCIHAVMRSSRSLSSWWHCSACCFTTPSSMSTEAGVSGSTHSLFYTQRLHLLSLFGWQL